jgi:hypothetical protein
MGETQWLSDPMTTKPNGKLPPFHPFFQRSWNAEIWKKVSPEARIVYLALCSKYRADLRNNGKLFLSTRTGAEELGFSKELVARCLHELAYYGFIVQTNAGWHGVGVKGTSPHWRLTELPYGNQPPTYDFERFNGKHFHEQKSPAYRQRLHRYLAELKARQAAQKSV